MLKKWINLWLKHDTRGHDKHTCVMWVSFLLFIKRADYWDYWTDQIYLSCFQSCCFECCCSSDPCLSWSGALRSLSPYVLSSYRSWTFRLAHLQYHSATKQLYLELQTGFWELTVQTAAPLRVIRQSVCTLSIPSLCQELSSDLLSSLLWTGTSLGLRGHPQ